MFVLKARHLMAAGLVSLAAWSAGAYAGAVEQLNAFVSNVSTARGEFVQRQVKGGTNGSPLRVAGTSNGDFVFSRPGRFVWRYVKPYEQQLSADGQMLYIFDKDLNQITERKLDASLGSSPAAILFGSNDLAKNFTLKEGGTKDGIDWAELTPKAKDTQFERIAIGFRSGELQGMELRDAFGNTTLLTFSNIQKNPQLPANVFRFTPPKGADVIKQ